MLYDIKLSNFFFFFFPSQEIDLNSLQEAPSVLGLLLSLYDKRRLGCMISHGLSEGLLSAMQSADPLTEVAGKLEQLNPDYRNMLKKLLRLFGRVRNYKPQQNMWLLMLLFVQINYHPLFVCCLFVFRY